VQLRAIGHLAVETEMNLRLIRSSGDNHINIGYASAFTVSNRYLLDMFKRSEKIVESIILAKILGATFLKRTQFVRTYDLTDWNYNDFKNLNKRVINFNLNEENYGKSLLREMGIGEDDWFVCLHSRDNAYHASRYRGGFSHHDFRDCDINNYMLAAEYIAKQGGYVLRMGAKIGKPLPSQRHPKIIDYASQYRSEFMDIFLPAHCKFFLGSTAGPFLLATIFGKPTAQANLIPLHASPFCPQDLFIPKKLWSLKEKRFLSFPEIFNSEIVHYKDKKLYDDAGIQVIENTAEEILGLATEMYLRLSDISVNEEESSIRSRYTSLYKPCHPASAGPPNICIDFLRRNIDLLESPNNC
jgi:putative glycosyltransferase (TIGR04372 family)